MNTIFENPQLNPDWLPHQSEIVFSPLPKTYRKVLLISLLIFLCVLLVGFMIFYLSVPEMTFTHFLFGVMGWIVISGALIWRLFKVFPYRGYAIRTYDIVYKKGWLWRTITTVPFARVQHCDIKQGLMERYFDLSKLNIYTAGGQNSDLTIPGLNMEEAEKYKRFILKTIASEEDYVNEEE